MLLTGTYCPKVTVSGVASRKNVNITIVTIWAPLPVRGYNARGYSEVLYSSIILLRLFPLNLSLVDKRFLLILERLLSRSYRPGKFNVRSFTNWSELDLNLCFFCTDAPTATKCRGDSSSNVKIVQWAMKKIVKETFVTIRAHTGGLIDGNKIRRQKFSLSKILSSKTRIIKSSSSTKFLSKTFFGKSLLSPKVFSVKRAFDQVNF